MVRGLAHELAPFADAEFDQVLITGVLQVVQRDHLLATAAAADRVLAIGGHLLVADFMPDAPNGSASTTTPNTRS